MSHQEILKTLGQNRTVIKRYGVRRLGLFGSASRGEDTAGSDLDFIVDLEKKTFDNYMGLKLELEDMFRRKVDLVLEASLKSRLRESVERDVLYVEGL